MRPRDRELSQRLEIGLASFNQERYPLLGVRDATSRDALIEQLVESVHRVEYVAVIRKRKLSERRANPNDLMFDPLKAAILHQRQGHLDEAFWLVFLFTHFGKHARGGWRYVREIYGRLGAEDQWDWANTSANPPEFRVWLNAHQGELMRKGVVGGFSNHRKYQSLNAFSLTGTGAAVQSYVTWVGPPRTHDELMRQAHHQCHGDPRQTFDALYRSMDAVVSFGRTARFDYLTMVSKLGLAPIEPGSVYLQGSTGPLSGARLLFAENETVALSRKTLDERLVELADWLNVGMQVLEDALCNWQKSPATFKPFRG